MKKIYETLTTFGLTVPADKKADFDKFLKENYRTKAEYDTAVAKGDDYKKSLDSVNEKLKAFDGVDVDGLKGQIEKLQGDLKAKDDEYAAKEADRLFQETLNEAIKNAGGRNTKSIKALLNVDELKASKNQGEDIKKALETVKKSDEYLFGSNEPFRNPVGPTGADTGIGSNLDAMRAAMGLPVNKK